MSAAAARKRLDETLSALADPTRRRVVDLLRVGPRRAGELSQAFDVSAPAMSRHLKVLRTRGLIEEERDSEDGRGRVYQLRRERFEELSGWLEEVEQFWDEQLTAFAEHVERTQADPRARGARRTKATPRTGAPRRGERR